MLKVTVNLLGPFVIFLTDGFLSVSFSEAFVLPIIIVPEAVGLAFVVVGDGDDGTVFVGHVVQRDLIVRSEGQTEELGYLDILLQQWICHVISPHF